MNVEDLARGPRWPSEDLDTRIKELKSDGASLLECILYVKVNQECALGEARDIVINSEAWISRRESFLREQEEHFQEFVDRNISRVDSIEQTFTPDGTNTIVKLKPSE